MERIELVLFGSANYALYANEDNWLQYKGTKTEMALAVSHLQIHPLNAEY